MPNDQKTNWQSSQSGELDRQLDAALAKYAAVEPRPGLEERVFANLNTERAQMADRPWWHWGLAGAFAVALIIAAAVAWKSHVPSQPVIANHPAWTAPLPPVPMPRVVAANANPPMMRSLHKTAAKSAPVPKLEVFPSPQPLSEQEQILAAYVRQFDDEAVLLARAQTELMLQDQQEELQAMHENSISVQRHDKENP
jgi:hypothetical protein